MAATLIGTLPLLYFGIKENALERVHPNKSPEVLSNRASELIARIGYPGKPVDREWGFAYNSDFIDYLSTHDKPHADWNKVPHQRPELLSFWYRQSPKELIPFSVAIYPVGKISGAASCFRPWLRLQPGPQSSSTKPSSMKGF